jgi:sigma-B regulation protein RsbU (phosphoserine phosphatase)
MALELIMESAQMETGIINLIQDGLTEKKTSLEQWREATSQGNKEVCLCSTDETVLDEHLHVIDACLHKIEEGTFGICEVCHAPVDSELLQMDYTATVCLGHYTETELRQLESELELSQVIQRAVLPQRIPAISGFDIAAFSRPAQIVSGDYFDFLQFKDGTYGIVVADVSGHGVSAGMLVTSLQMAFHTLASENSSPAAVLERINHIYIHNINFSTFVTIFFASLDPKTRMLSYANAGHNPPLIYRPSTNEMIWLKPTGAAVGLMEYFNVRPANIQLMAGDIVLFYTDGITEAVNPQGDQQFGFDRLANVIRQNENLSAEGLTSKIRQALNEFMQGSLPADDVTLVVSKVN